MVSEIFFSLAIFKGKHNYVAFDSGAAVIKEKVKSAPAKKGKNVVSM